MPNRGRDKAGGDSPSATGERPAPTSAARHLSEPLDSAEDLSADAIDVVSGAFHEEDSAPPSIPSAAVLDSELTHPTIPGVTKQIHPGSVLAHRYEVTSVLGEGGMGIVYRCRDQASGENVAVKIVVPPEGKHRDEYIMWFYKEARALAALNHAAIVRALDFGQLVDGSPYLAMDLVPGISLHDLAQARLSWPLIWSLGRQVFSALAHAHARGIVHGDLKPSNVLVEEVDGDAPRVHMLDFGLAWLKQDPHDERLDGEKALEFTPHAGAGTPGYMAPEQIQHEMHHVYGPTDLYAIGCILYKLISGRSVFHGDPKELLKLHAYEKVPKLDPRIEVPTELPKFVHRLLRKRPWDRFEYAADALREWDRWRPPPKVDPKVWVFPKVTRVDSPRAAESTKATGETPPSRGLEAAAEHAPGLLSIRPSPMVGREDAREQLLSIAKDIIEGEGSPHRLAILVGPAGVGKSRLAEWLCETMHERGAMVPLKSRYRPVRGPLDGMLGAVVQNLNFERSTRETIERSLLSRWNVAADDKNGRAWVAGAAEWLRPARGGDAAIGPSGMRFTLDTLEVRRHVIRYTLRRIAGKRPLLFWFDDLHHAAETTFEGLLRIHRNEPDIRIMMVATVRAEDVQLGTPAAERIRQLRETMRGDVIDLQALDEETTCNLLRASLPLDDPSTLEAARRSRGNPLFALQQLHAWALAGQMEFLNGVYRVPPEVLAVRPKTTAELWDSRVAALPETQRVAAYAVASLGIDVRRDVLHALLTSLSLPADEAINNLQVAEIILPRGPGRYSWPHALLLEHLIAQLNEREDRGRVYRAAAEALGRHPAANTRRVVRQRVINLLNANAPDTAASMLFDFISDSWNGAREPSATIADLELLKGHVKGRSLALKHRWQAEALRHVGRPEEARTHADIARASFEELEDEHNMAHALRLLGHVLSEIGESAEGLLLSQLAYQIFQNHKNVLGQAQCEAVVAELEYLLGNYERARAMAEAGDEHFALLEQPLGRGQCLLLLSWIDHSEGATERSRRLTLEARHEFESAGYRLGIAQTDASLAHIEHRLLNYFSAARGAEDALSAFETLNNPRGQAGSERLLAMIGIDTDDLDKAEIHASRAAQIFESLADPWGVVESRLLSCQVALARRDLDNARDLFNQATAISVEEAEPKQHRLLTQTWLAAESGDMDGAFDALEAASDVFGNRSRAGDHTPHLLARFARNEWPPHVYDRIQSWRALLHDRSRHDE